MSDERNRKTLNWIGRERYDAVRLFKRRLKQRIRKLAEENRKDGQKYTIHTEDILKLINETK